MSPAIAYNSSCAVNLGVNGAFVMTLQEECYVVYVPLKQERQLVPRPFSILARVAVRSSRGSKGTSSRYIFMMRNVNMCSLNLTLAYLDEILC